MLGNLISLFSNSNIIGLDIGADNIKMVEVAHEKNRLELATYGVAKHNLDLEGYWGSSKLRPLATMIEDILNSGEFSGVKTVMSVRSKDVYVTTMDFSASLSKKQIEQEINKQAKYFLPYPPEEMRLSWSIIKQPKEVVKQTGKRRVIINALPDFVIENSKNLLEHVNLDGIALENQTVSQIRALLTPDKGNTIMVDIGGDHTTFSVTVDGVLRSSSHIKSGTSKISTDLSHSLGIDPEVAEYFKKDLSLVNLYHLPKQVLDYFSILKSELNTFIELNKKIGQVPEKVVFTGGGIYTPGFVEFFRDYHTPIYLGNCFRDIHIPKEIKPHIMMMINQLSTAIGLALRKDY